VVLASTHESDNRSPQATLECNLDRLADTGLPPEIEAILEVLVELN